MDDAAPHVVVVGAGFAGLAAARALAGEPVRVTLVDPSDRHTFVPLLYQVATGTLEPDDVAPDLAGLLRSAPNVTVRRGSLAALDRDRRTVVLDDATELGYDALVLATGSVPATFGVPGADEHALPLDDLDDAVVLRDHLAVTLADDPTATIAVVGGGATGVEVAGALTDLARRTGARPKVVLVELEPSLLGRYRPPSRQHAYDALRDRGVEVVLATGVERVGPGGLRLADGRLVRTRTVVWATGVRGDPLAGRLGLPVDGAGRVVVDRSLRVPGWGAVFVAGDLALACDERGAAYPQLAPVAIQAGQHAAAEIRRAQRGEASRPFRFRDLGTLAIVAERSAVADLPLGITLTGTPAWLLWLAVHVATLPGLHNQAAVVARWVGQALGRLPAAHVLRGVPCAVPPWWARPQPTSV